MNCTSDAIMQSFPILIAEGSFKINRARAVKDVELPISKPQCSVKNINVSERRHLFPMMTVDRLPSRICTLVQFCGISVIRNKQLLPENSTRSRPFSWYHGCNSRILSVPLSMRSTAIGTSEFYPVERAHCCRQTCSTSQLE